jgi:M3 family oligoendopeptidase
MASGREPASYGMETGEVHSMSMEFFAWRYTDRFFGAKARQYQFCHVFDALTFIPYGTIVDSFQHIVYEHPEMTPEQRKTAWRELEAQYRPYLSAEGIPYLEEGTRWQYQMHIFEMPFYYIDYCLAQVVALEFLFAARQDYDDAFKRYVRFVSHGGTLKFSDLVSDAGLVPPFEEQGVKDVVAKTEALVRELQA